LPEVSFVQSVDGCRIALGLPHSGRAAGEHCTCLAVVALMPRLSVAVAILFVAIGLLGMGNGAVFQLVPQRFPNRIGIVTGVVGAAGGLGGFFLPFVLGAVRDATGSYAAGLFGCAATFFCGTLVLLELALGGRNAGTARPSSGPACTRIVERSLQQMTKALRGSEAYVPKMYD
jgi:nitrate/nitrite transporter NarK